MAPMSFMLRIPCLNNQRIDIDLHPGEVIFVLGPNGSGKSSLMHQIFSVNRSAARRIFAHRQTWFTSNTLIFSPEQKRQTERQIQSEDAHPQSRWLDNHSGTRPGIAIYELIDAENIRARAIAGAVDGGDMNLAQTLSRRDAPVKVINELMRLSSIPISISVQGNEEVVASKAGSAPYSIAQLSDGERNALLIAAEVLTAKPGTLMIIDEPERHLHRSIISPLLTLLFRSRADCAFVVSTHEIMLPIDNPSTRTLLLRNCQYEGSSVTAWDADVLPPSSTPDDELRTDILGARRSILFVEGVPHSLDKPLFSLLFPDVSVVAKASCRDVEHAVAGIRDSEELHWVKAFGLVDSDRRPESELSTLRARGVYALPVICVESIYYHAEIQRRVAERHSSVTGDDPAVRIADAKAAALAVIRPHARRLSERVAEKEIRTRLLEQLPQRAQIASGATITMSVDPMAVVEREIASFSVDVEKGDLSALIGRYPIRETQALSEIARKLGFQGRDQYENAVRKLLLDDTRAIQWLRGLFSELISAIASGSSEQGAVRQ